MEALYECAGIVAGDGSIYSVSSGTIVLEVRGSSDEFDYYTTKVKPLFSELFGQELKVIKRNYSGGFCYGIRKCGVEVKRIFCGRLGFPIGKKSRIVRIPSEVLRSKRHGLKAAFIRGLFDTDGSVYLRNARARKYFHPVAEVSSVSPVMREQLKLLFRELGFNAWIEKEGKVRLGGWSTVQRFFEVVKPNNPKHILRYHKLILSGIAGVA